jgi:hypothetical protein
VQSEKPSFDVLPLASNLYGRDYCVDLPPRMTVEHSLVVTVVSAFAGYRVGRLLLSMMGATLREWVRGRSVMAPHLNVAKDRRN